MTRPSTRAVRRAAADLSDQMTPHLNTAKDTLVADVVPKVMSTGAAVLPRAKAVGAEVLPKAKRAGVGAAVRVGLMEPPKKRHPWRLAAIVGGVAAGAYVAWNRWRLPHASDDWAHADGATGQSHGDAPQEAEIPGVPADPRVAF